MTAGYVIKIYTTPLLSKAIAILSRLLKRNSKTFNAEL